MEGSTSMSDQLPALVVRSSAVRAKANSGQARPG